MLLFYFGVFFLPFLTAGAMNTWRLLQMSKSEITDYDQEYRQAHRMASIECRLLSNLRRRLKAENDFPERWCLEMPQYSAQLSRELEPYRTRQRGWGAQYDCRVRLLESAKQGRGGGLKSTQWQRSLRVIEQPPFSNQWRSKALQRNQWTIEWLEPNWDLSGGQI